MRLALLVALVPLTTACRNPTAEDSVGDIKWNENRAKWSALGITSYDLRMVSECFCGAPSGTVLVVVRQGALTSRTVEATGLPVDPAYAKWFPDVPGLFGVVRNAIDQKASSLGVQYDKTYGYPSIIQIDFGGGSFGDKVNYRVQSFTVAP